VIVELISATTAKTGLAVRCELDSPGQSLLFAEAKT
jgi:hypothetical protein